MNRTPDAEMRAHIRRTASRTESGAIPGTIAHESALAVLLWLDDTGADPPPNTERVRIVVDVSPVYRSTNTRVAYVANEAFGVRREEDGWERSIVVADVPAPEPIAVVRGTVEGP